MTRYFALLLWLAFASTVLGQTITRQNLGSILGFENGSPGAFPKGWGSIGPASTIVIDDSVVHSGKYSARVERDSSTPETFSGVSISIPIDFAGEKIEWHGFLKTENVNGFVALYLREDGDTPSIAFATLQGLNLNGTRDWTEYSVSIPIVREGKQLHFGFLLSGTGKAWVDDLRLLVDGKPVAQAGNRLTVLDTDREFDAGSRIMLTNLTNAQIKNLAMLAKVWGFLKYHHPAVTGGFYHWDYELFRILPRVLGAADGAAASAEISNWITALGTVEPCIDCVTLDANNLYLAPDLDWIAEESTLGAELSAALLYIHRNRNRTVKQFYVSLSPSVANPVFENELAYGGLKLPDSGYQLLGLFRFWNIVQYFYPGRDIMADDPGNSPNYWSNVLDESISGIALAQDAKSYQQELMKFIAKTHDTHANLWSSIDARPPIGSCQLPVDIRFVEGRPLVLRHTSATAGPASGLLPGDLIEQLDGAAIEDLIKQWKPFYITSNESGLLHYVGLYMTRGTCGPTAVAVRRGKTSLNVTSSRVPVNSLDFSASNTHDLPGDAFQIISDQIAYLKLSSVTAAESVNYIQAAAGTKGLIIDIRNYPSEYVVYALGQLLVSKPTDFVRFTYPDVMNPGALHWMDPIVLTPQQPHYSGKVAILVDEVTLSSAEYHAMAFRTAPGATVIGSTTAGADGDVSAVPLPGGFRSGISGLGVFYPDKRATQRIGIIPDIVVRPTIEGIRAGRDELIERAIQILSPESTLEVSLTPGANVASTVGSAGPLQTGYAKLDVNLGSAPYATAVFSARQSGVTFSEAGIPASASTTRARIFIDYRSAVPALPGHPEAGTVDVNTGIAIVNQGSSTSNVTYTLRDSNGYTLSTGHGTVKAGNYLACFIDQLKDKAAADFTFPSDFQSAVRFGSLEIAGDYPLSILALRGTTNQRNEFLVTTTPISDLTLPLSSSAVQFPQFADGGGYTTSLILMNTSSSAETGLFQIMDKDGKPFIVNQAGGEAGFSFKYSIPPGGVFHFQTDGFPDETKAGWVKLSPDAGTASPIGSGVFGYNPAKVLVSESGVPSAVPTTHAHIYMDLSNRHNTGLAIANVGNVTAEIRINAYEKDGATAAGASEGTLSLPADGYTAGFADQFIAGLPEGFTGLLDIRSATPFAALTLRSLTNERNEFLMTTFPIADQIVPAPLPIIFPQIADGGGYTTRFFFFSQGETSSATLSFWDEAGSLLAIGSGNKVFP